MPEKPQPEHWPAALRACHAGRVTIVCLFLALASGAFSQPVLWSSLDGGNDHWYEVIAVPEGITWSNASLAATNRGGYLATAVSSNENAFIFAVANEQTSTWNNGYGPWLGGFQPVGSPEPGGGWAWITGEPFTYSNWAPVQPNNNGGEDRIHFGGLSGRSSAWNDLGQNEASYARGYVVEYNPPAAVLTIEAGVIGSTSPAQRIGEPVTNGGFVISNCCPSTPSGDAIDESTRWRFDFAMDPDLRSFLEPTELSSAILTLTMTPGRSGIGSDSVRIEGLPAINPPILEALAAGVTTNIQVELLQYYSSQQILSLLQETAGNLAMRYEKDALISFARLELSRPDLRVRIRIRRLDGLLQLCWNSELNKSYQVQYRTDLPDFEWVNLAGLLGNGVTNCINATQSSPNRLYRVVRLPRP